MTVDTRGNVVPRTPQAAVTAATMYLLNNQPPAGDPRTAMHRSTIVGLGLIEAALDKEPVPDHKKGQSATPRPRPAMTVTTCLDAAAHGDTIVTTMRATTSHNARSTSQGHDML